MTSKILIVDDEIDIVNMLRDYFELNGYEVMTATCGNEALKKAGNKPDIILLDINMPDIDGINVCKRIRDFISCPILFLTAKIEDSDKIKGFAVGGDDYIVKPFSIEELLARVSAHIRREHRIGVQAKVHFDSELVIDYSEKAVYFRNEHLNLAKKEFDIIEFLSENAGQVFDKERIYESVWSFDSDGDSSVIAEHIRRIRQKLSLAGAKNYIETVWGCGYKWVK